MSSENNMHTPSTLSVVVFEETQSLKLKFTAAQTLLWPILVSAFHLLTFFQPSKPHPSAAAGWLKQMSYLLTLCDLALFGVKMR